MLRAWKTAAVAAPLTLAALALGGYAYTRAHAAPTYRLANGIEVIPTVNPQDETAQLLEIKSWDFEITQSDARKPLYISFALYGNGKFVKTINGGTARFPNPSSTLQKGPITTHVTFVCLPLGGSLFDSRELKFRMTMRGGSITGTMPNPILKGHGFSSGAQAVPPDNVILLLSTNRTKSYISGNMADNDTYLALSLTETPPR